MRPRIGAEYSWVTETTNALIAETVDSSMSWGYSLSSQLDMKRRILMVSIVVAKCPYADLKLLFPQLTMVRFWIGIKLTKQLELEQTRWV